MKAFTLDHTLNPASVFKDVEKFFVGFDDHFNRLAKLHDDVTKNIPNYPPCNIRKTGENTYVIEMALAGFARQDIEIEFVDDKLVVKGNAKEDDDGQYIFKGIAARNFTRTFAINDHIEIKDAELFNGMLKIALERLIPEHKKAKKIEVKEGGTAGKKLLTERDEK